MEKGEQYAENTYSFNGNRNIKGQKTVRLNMKCDKNIPMDAVTKTYLSDEMIRQITCATIGSSTVVQSIKRLSGGFCSAVYLVETQQDKLVLKVGTNTNVKVMRHEVQYIATEAKMLQEIGEKTDILMPKLIAYDDSKTIVDVPYFFMSYLDGTPLDNCGELSETRRNEIYNQIGQITRAICNIPAECFGIPLIPESYCSKNSEFVNLLFDWLLQDAEEEQIPIPYLSPDDLRRLIHNCAAELDSAEKPVLAHTDTWAGNIMVRNGQFAGLVDYAAIYYGDPLLSHDSHDFGASPNPWFLRGYGKETFDADEQVRIQVYRIWQRLGMVVERGYRKYSDAHLYDWVLPETEKEIRMLEEMRKRSRL